MAIFARFNGLITMKVTPALIVLTLGMISGNSAHAEKYCKSVDESGNASYIIAPSTGCKKQFKTVGVSHFKAAPATISTTQPSTSDTTIEKTIAPTAANTTQMAMPVVQTKPSDKRNPENQ